MSLLSGPLPRRPWAGRKRSLAPRILATLLVLAGMGRVWADADLGFTISPLFPITQGMVPYADPSPRKLAKGEIEVSSALTWTNSLRLDDGSRWPGYSLIVDGETLVSRSALSAGLGGGFVLGAWCEGSALFPGIMDGGLSAFHHLFHFANQWRDEVPPDRLDIRVSTPAGLLMSVSEPEFAWDSFGLRIDWSPPRRGLPTLVAMLKIPLAREAPWLFESEMGASFGASCSLSWRRLELGMAAGLAWQPHASTLDSLPMRDFLPQTSAKLFFAVAPGLSLGAEGALMLSPFAVDEWYLGGIVGNLWMGSSIKLGKSMNLEAAIIEELASWASIEVGFQVGLRRAIE